MHSLQPQQNAQLRPRGHDENILEEAYRGRYARQRLLNFWPESSCGYHAIKRFVCIIQVEPALAEARATLRSIEPAALNALALDLNVSALSGLLGELESSTEGQGLSESEAADLENLVDDFLCRRDRLHLLKAALESRGAT